MNNQRTQFISLTVLFAIVAIVVLLLWLPYLKIIALGAVLAILFSPVYRKIFKESRSKTIAGALTVVLVVLIVFVPLYLIGQAVFNEMLGLYHNFQAGNANINMGQVIGHLPQGAQEVIANFTRDIGQRISGIAGAAVGGITGIISNIASFAASFFLIMFTLFYLLRDGDSIKSYLGGLLPLSEGNKNLLVQKIESAISGVVKGSFLVALIQGVVATVGFLIFGIHNVLLWGSFTVLAALVPTVGTSLAIIPAVLLLLITGHTGQAIGLLIWGMVAVGTIDNFVGPRLVSSRTDLHPLLVLFSILGGIAFFGFIGFLLGPITMAIFVALLDIYRTDLKENFGS